MAEYSLIGQQIHGYTIVRKLGSGGYGTVYLGEKEDLGKVYQTAIKHISIPNAEGYESVLQDYGYDKAAAQAHFEKMVEGITAEINTLLAMSKKDNRHIVAYYDHSIQRSTDPLRYDIFLRMEYLTPLNRHIREKGMTLGEIVRLGLNMCEALSLCHNSGVMHRDIKEANIFISEDGSFKLGDFGVAKAAIETTQAGSIKGTASYMAPEIYLREPYDNSVDIYSLGIVLYKLLNYQRLPFMPDAPAPFSVDDKNQAETRRLKGETPPLPAQAKNRLGEVVVKACSGKAARYARAEELKADLQEFLKSISNEDYASVIIPRSQEAVQAGGAYPQEPENTYTQTQGATITMGAQNAAIAPPAADQNPYAKPERPKKEKKKGKKRFILIPIAVILIAAVCVAGYTLYTRFTDPVNQFQEAIMGSDFSQAAQLYLDKIKDGDAKKLEQAEKFVVTHAEGVRDQYKNGDIEYEDTLTQLQEMGKLGIVSSGELQPMIEEVNELRTSRAAYENAQANMESGDWKSAISELRKVIPSDADYAQAQTKLADAIRNYKNELLGSITDYTLNGEYEEAIAVLRAGLQVVPDDADLLAKIADVEKQISDEIDLAVAAIIQSASSAAANNADYRAALAELRDASKQYPNRDDIKDAIADVELSYLEFVFANADALVEEKRFDDAVSQLNDLKKDISDDEAVDDKIAQINNLRPVDLSRVVVIDSKSYGYTSGLFTDSFGYTYDGRHSFYCASDAYGVFNLAGQYSTFSGTIVSNQNTDSDAVMEIAIYADDKLVYSKTGFTKRTGAIDFSVDVRGVTKLGIYTDANTTWRTSYTSIVNAQLEK